MTRSMTGFGRGVRESAFGQIAVEARSVNHRFLKVHLRVHPMLEALEAEIENRLRARVVRGAVNLSVDVKPRDPAAPPQTDPELAAARLTRLRNLWTALFPDAGPIEPARLFDAVLRLPPPPGPASGASEEAGRAAFEALDDALSALEASREAEGLETARAVEAHRACVARLRDQIAARSSGAIKAAQARFAERIQQLLEDTRPGLALEPEVLLRESALYADRGDIGEELARLEGHLRRFDEILGAPSEAGRRLEFLLQEMLREANTIGSKSLDLGISHDVVEIKAEIEKMKEQVQNLE
jgi:uncharacterized protein (TIGR00255 family)